MISDIELYLKGNKLIIGEVLGGFIYTFANTREKINHNDTSCSVIVPKLIKLIRDR